MQRDFFLNKIINEIKNILKLKQIQPIDLLIFSQDLHKKFNSEFQFTESFDINQKISLLDQEMGGIPYLAKDIYNTKLFKTEMGSFIWKDFFPGNNARIIDTLNSSGCINWKNCNI